MERPHQLVQSIVLRRDQFVALYRRCSVCFGGKRRRQRFAARISALDNPDDLAAWFRGHRLAPGFPRLSPLARTAPGGAICHGRGGIRHLVALAARNPGLAGHDGVARRHPVGCTGLCHAGRSRPDSFLGRGSTDRRPASGALPAGDQPRAAFDSALHSRRIFHGRGRRLAPVGAGFPSLGRVVSGGTGHCHCFALRVFHVFDWRVGRHDSRPGRPADAGADRGKIFGARRPRSAHWGRFAGHFAATLSAGDSLCDHRQGRHQGNVSRWIDPRGAAHRDDGSLGRLGGAPLADWAGELRSGGSTRGRVVRQVGAAAPARLTRRAVQRLGHAGGGGRGDGMSTRLWWRLSFIATCTFSGTARAC